MVLLTKVDMYGIWIEKGLTGNPGPPALEEQVRILWLLPPACVKAAASLVEFATVFTFIWQWQPWKRSEVQYIAALEEEVTVLRFSTKLTTRCN